jgi:hypothetical protein
VDGEFAFASVSGPRAKYVPGIAILDDGRIMNALNVTLDGNYLSSSRLSGLQLGWDNEPNQNEY